MITIPLDRVEFKQGDSVTFPVISKTDQLKQTTIHTATVAIPEVVRDITLCIKEYISRFRKAKFMCTKATPLFTDLTSGLPYHADRLRLMAKALMGAAGIDTVRFTAYSLKAAGLSGRASAGETIHDLETAARLSHKSRTLGRFYVKTVTKH
jgi:hypothetical protein